jgi:hypothetical protein
LIPAGMEGRRGRSPGRSYGRVRRNRGRRDPGAGGDGRSVGARGEAQLEPQGAEGGQGPSPSRAAEGRAQEVQPQGAEGVSPQVGVGIGLTEKSPVPAPPVTLGLTVSGSTRWAATCPRCSRSRCPGAVRQTASRSGRSGGWRRPSLAVGVP